jgi:hypothetical protein
MKIHSAVNCKVQNCTEYVYQVLVSFEGRLNQFVLWIADGPNMILAGLESIVFH